MNKKTRLIILLFCVLCFLIIAPILVAYSEGYRFDFENMRVTETGGIYVRTFPAADKITIDSNITQKPGVFSNWIFVQSLLPKNHTVSITKSGYYDYFKTLPVQEKQVTKLENVTLFQKNIQFSPVLATVKSPFVNVEKFIIKNNNLYYSTSAENAGLTATQKATPVIKSLVAFNANGNNITWLGTDGFLYQSDISTPLTKPVKLSLVPLKISKSDTYKIIISNQSTFLVGKGNLLLLDEKTKSFNTFYSQVTDMKISPDGKNMVYFNNNNIFISVFPATTSAKQKNIYQTSDKISDLLWLNNDYIIFVSGDKIIISEIDYRGNINSITLPQSATKISFNSQEGKLYVLNQNILLASGKITP